MKQRELNLELLRILAMFLIVLWHFLIKGTIHYGEGEELAYIREAPMYNVALYSALAVVSSCGVDLFVLLSGYFLSVSYTLKVSRIFHIWIITLFYLVIIGIGLLIIYPGQYDPVGIIKDMRPITGSNYWFVKSYLGMVLLAPFMAKVMTILNKRSTLAMIIVIAVLSFRYTGNYFDTNNNLRLFVLLFFIAGYIRKFGLPKWVDKHGWQILGGIWTVQIAFSMVEIYTGASTTSYRGWGIENNSLTILTSILVFSIFMNLKVFKYRKVLENISQYTFAIYLIHDNNYIADLLWNKWLNINMGSPYYMVDILLIPLMIYGICVLADMIRKWLFSYLHITQIEDKLNKFNVPIGE